MKTVNAFSVNPNVAATHEAVIAKIMHSRIGLNGKRPGSQKKARKDSADNLVPHIPKQWTASAKVARIFGRKRDSMVATLAILRARGFVESRRKPGARETEWRAAQ